MFTVGTEDEAEEETLMGVIAEAFIRKIGELIRFQIEDGDRLRGQSFLRAVAVVQERGVASVGAESNGGGKAVGAGDAAGRRDS